MPMSKFVLLRNIRHVMRDHITSLAAPPTHNSFYFIQIHPFCSSSSSSLESVDKSLKNRRSFTVNYLINSCGLTPERAVSASKHVNFKVADKPNSVLVFFKDQGFTQTQISKVIHNSPALLKCNPEKNFFPKIVFFKSKGISDSEVATIVSRSPEILTRSLENCLIPCFDFFSDFLQSKEKANVSFRRFLGFPCYHLEKYMKPNIEMMKQAGVPVRNIRSLVTHHPNVLFTNCDESRRVLEEVKKMGFNPLNSSFLIAVLALVSMTKLTWDRKIEVYKQWGWSQNDIVSAFRKNPWCMTLSEHKITSVIGFLVNTMGMKSSVLAHRPEVLSLSLENRIVPRCNVYKALVSKGLLKPGNTCLTTMIRYSEKYFLERTIGRHEDEAPDLLKVYKQKLDLAK